MRYINMASYKLIKYRQIKACVRPTNLGAAGIYVCNGNYRNMLILIEKNGTDNKGIE